MLAALQDDPQGLPFQPLASGTLDALAAAVRSVKCG